MRIKGMRLVCVPQDAWQHWEAYWDRPDVKAKSEQQCRNRLSKVAEPGTDPSRYTGGSRSDIEHYHVLQNELQHEPDVYEYFARTHVKKDGHFVDERSKKIAEEVQSRAASATQEAGESS